MRSERAVSALPLLLLFCLAACGGGKQGTIKIGAIFDLTGPTADVGTTYSEGLRAYVDWQNAEGGIAGRPIELLYQNYGYKVDQAEQLYSQFVGAGVVAFMGWGTGDTEALRGRIADDQIPFMSASYSHVLGDPAEAPYNFLVGITYTDQLKIMLDYLLELNPGAPLQVALMHHASPFGISPYQQHGHEYAQAKGIELTLYEMPRDATDYTAQLTRIAQSGARHVIFQNTSSPVARVLGNARTLGLDFSFACLNWCSNDVMIELAKENAEAVLGIMPYGPPSAAATGLEGAGRYLEGKGLALADQSALWVQGWWTKALTAHGARPAPQTGEPTGATIKAALETFDQVSTGDSGAPISFSPADHRGMKPARNYRVAQGRFTPISELRTPGG